MSATLKKIVLLFAAFTVVVFLVFLFNQTMQIVTSARAVNPTLGRVVLWALIVLYCTLLLTPVVLWFRIPRSAFFPQSRRKVPSMHPLSPTSRSACHAILTFTAPL